MVDTKGLPLGNVVMGDTGIVGGIGSVAGLVGNDSHSLNGNHTLQSQVGLVSNHSQSGSTGLKLKRIVLTPEIQQSHPLRSGLPGTAPRRQGTQSTG